MKQKKESWIGKSSDSLRAGMVKMCHKYNMDYDYSVEKVLICTLQVWLFVLKI